MAGIRAAVVGVGYLGQFHAEKYAKHPGVELVGVVDQDPVRSAQVAEKNGTKAFGRMEDLLGAVDAVSIVVPTVLHHRVARLFLERGVHVLLEKPVTVTVQEADELIALAASKKAVLQVGHIERFNPAVTEIKKRLKAPRYLQAERAAPFTVRCTDVNVVLDLMIHDLDIVADLAGSEPQAVSSAGAAVITTAVDAATARILFANGSVADVTASRVSEEKKRLLRVYDGDTLYTADYQAQKAACSRRGEGDVPTFPAEDLPSERRDTLDEEIKAFIACVQQGTRPLVSGAEGRRALALARIITEAIERGERGFVPVP